MGTNEQGSGKGKLIPIYTLIIGLLAGASGTAYLSLETIGKQVVTNTALIAHNREMIEQLRIADEKQRQDWREEISQERTRADRNLAVVAEVIKSVAESNAKIVEQNTIMFLKFGIKSSP